MRDKFNTLGKQTNFKTDTLKLIHNRENQKYMYTYIFMVKFHKSNLMRWKAVCLQLRFERGQSSAVANKRWQRVPRNWGRMYPKIKHGVRGIFDGMRGHDECGNLTMSVAITTLSAHLLLLIALISCTYRPTLLLEPSAPVVRDTVSLNSYNRLQLQDQRWPCIFSFWPSCLASTATPHQKCKKHQ